MDGRQPLPDSNAQARAHRDEPACTGLQPEASDADPGHRRNVEGAGDVDSSPSLLGSHTGPRTGPTPRTSPSDMRTGVVPPTIKSRPSPDPAPRFYTASATCRPFLFRINQPPVGPGRSAARESDRGA